MNESTPATKPVDTTENESEVSVQNQFPCSLVRGGTSKGMLVQAGELPTDQHDEAIIDAFGSGEPRQIDGIGGATSTTSKLMIVASSSRPDVDVEYTFGQVDIEQQMIDYGGNCGNMTTAVGPFAYDHHMTGAMHTSPEHSRTQVRLLNTNTGAYITQTFPTAHGQTVTDGSFSIHGVPGTGAEVKTKFHNPGGAKTNALFPLGEPTTEVEVDGKSIRVSVVDVTTPVAFVHADEFGLAGTELPNTIDSNPELLERIERLRGTICVELGFVETVEEASTKSPGFPKLAFVSEPQNYSTDTGTVDEHEIDITARIMSMQYLHPIYAVTGAGCTAAAVHLEGTIPNQVATPSNSTVILGHPKGLMEVGTEVENGIVGSVTMSRTQRPLMQGDVFHNIG